MANSIRNRARSGNGSRRRQRVRVLAALVAICGDLERLQEAAEAQVACREVGDRLRRMLAREQRRSAEGAA